jgi:hypothetical protein
MTQFQPVKGPLKSSVIEMVTEPMRAYNYTPGSEPKLTSPLEVVQAIKGIWVGKALGSARSPNSVLRHLPKFAITVLTKLFTAVLRRQYCIEVLRQHSTRLSLKSIVWTQFHSSASTTPYSLESQEHCMSAVSFKCFDNTLLAWVSRALYERSLIEVLRQHPTRLSLKSTVWAQFYSSASTTPYSLESQEHCMSAVSLKCFDNTLLAWVPRAL